MAPEWRTERTPLTVVSGNALALRRSYAAELPTRVIESIGVTVAGGNQQVA